jgi:hypothetical protein
MAECHLKGAQHGDDFAVLAVNVAERFKALRDHE